MDNRKIKNRIKELATVRGISNYLIAIKCNVHYTTVSQWFSNRQQPNIENIIKILDLLEVDFSDIMVYEKKSVNTKLGENLEANLNELLKTHSLQIELYNDKNGRTSKVYNPVIIKAIEDTEKEHRKQNEK